MDSEKVSIREGESERGGGRKKIRKKERQTDRQKERKKENPMTE